MQLDPPLTVYVPAASALPLILHGSGIVGSPAPEGNGRVRIDFEGDKYDSASIVTFADKVLIAAGRHVENYPTVARMHVRPTDLYAVATFDGSRVQIDGHGEMSDGRALYKLAEWLDCGRVFGGQFRPNGDQLAADLLLTRAHA